MHLFNTIKAKFIINLLAAVGAILISVIVAYFIATSSIKTLMTNDLTAVADSLEKTVVYISEINPEAYKDQRFKEDIFKIKVGSSGYVYFLDAKGVFRIHHKDEGKEMAGHDYIDHIRSHKEGGVYEYISASTGQEKIAAFRYIPAWDMWVVPGINKADYFDDLRASFFEWFLILGRRFNQTSPYFKQR
ncbi:MAG: Cache 3/Cache 2 fusion domain-containing protein [Epsilonproteobacteria bacterium]|nr:Cache 3/Cache 2 fusion domain-containing protein [Campylobacterota bacterium]